METDPKSNTVKSRPKGLYPLIIPDVLVYYKTISRDFSVSVFYNFLIKFFRPVVPEQLQEKEKVGYKSRFFSRISRNSRKSDEFEPTKPKKYVYIGLQYIHNIILQN